MNLKSVKTAADLPFTGIELVRVDKNITEVLIGGKLRIRVANTYSTNLELLVEAPFEAATRYRVTGTLDGFDPKITHYEGEYEAKRAVEDFEARGATAVLEKVEVQIDEAGNVVGDNDPAPPAAKQPVDDLPF